MDPRSKVRVSKQLALMLRHRPEAFGIALDRFGFAPLEDVLVAVKERDAEITRSDIQEIVDDPGKQRFEILEDRIRARYGHSVPIQLDREPVEPSEFLYHGTDPTAAEVIEREGLKPAGRQYVHLSLTPEVATQIGRRRSDTPVILRILAGQAHRAGIKFYDCGQVILTENVPPEFVERLSEEPPPSETSFGRRRRRVIR